jgi:hypothetical protein
MQNKNTGAGDHGIESVVYICCAEETIQLNNKNRYLP